MQSELIKHLKNVGVTANGRTAFATMGTPLEELFAKMGACRGESLVHEFDSAFRADEDMAIRALLYLRDCRGGMGEREHFRELVTALPKDKAIRVMLKVPELGRFDDLLAFLGLGFNDTVLLFWLDELYKGNGLAAKWLPRKGPVFKAMAKLAEMGYGDFRRMIVGLTNVVETQMCQGNWDEINFNHVPSKAMTIYRKAFHRHTEKYGQWLDDLKAGKPTAKVNVKGVFPHEVVKAGPGLADAMWDAMPEFENAGSILPIIDVSGSMGVASGAQGYSCMDIAVSLGAFLSEKCVGPFQNHFITFSSAPKLQELKGQGILNKLGNLKEADWGFNTDLDKSMRLILDTAKRVGLPQDQMPKVLLVLSDMQFDSPSYGGRNNIAAGPGTIKMFQDAGYEPPLVVFWNLREYAESRPTDGNDSGVMMVSGFSPTILNSILNNQSKSNLEMIEDTLSNPRYDY